MIWNFSTMKRRPIWNYFEIWTEELFASQTLSSIKASILLILLKCIVLGFSNGNTSFTSRLFSNYGSLNMLFYFFDISFILWCFLRDFFQKVYETILFQLKFQKSISRYKILQKIRVSNFVILKWWHVEYKLKSWTICPFLELFFQK